VVGRVELPFVRERLAGLGVTASSRTAPPSGEWVLVVDCYDPEVRRASGRCDEAALRVLVDDLGEPPPIGYDVVWNPNAHGDAGMYTPFDGEVITGPSAVPVRAGLPRWSPEGGACIGIALGGGSISAPLREIIARLARVSGTTLAVAGDAGPAGCERIEPARLWARLARCDRLLVSAGTSIWEAAVVGIPVVVLQIAENQRLNAEWVRRQGIPTIDATAGADAAAIADAVAAALPHARSLPNLDGGAARVADALFARAARALSR